MATQTAVSHNSAHCQSENLGDFHRALTAWCRAKEAIRSAIRREDFQSFVRPMYLAGVLSGKFFVISLPPNRRVIERAKNFQTNLSAFIEREGYHFAGFTSYPSDDELFALRDHPSFGPFYRLIARKRMERIIAQRAAENARDKSGICLGRHDRNR